MLKDIGHGPLDLSVPLPADLQAALAALAAADPPSRALLTGWLLLIAITTTSSY